jgi:hypothetical protein
LIQKEKFMKATTFARVTGSMVLGTGLMGFVPGILRNRKVDDPELAVEVGYGRIAGVIPTNLLFNLVRLGIGVGGLVASRSEKNAVIYNRLLAANYAGMALMGMIPILRTEFGLMPLHGGNIFLHSAVAAVAPFTDGFISRGLAPRQAVTQMADKAPVRRIKDTVRNVIPRQKYQTRIQSDSMMIH